jgi:hypothetical protein
MFQIRNIRHKITRQLQKKAYRNRAGVFGGPAGKLPHIAAGIFPKPCSGTFMSRHHAFPGRTRTSLKVNLSTPRPKGRGLPFDKLKAPSTAEGLEVHPEPYIRTPS